MKKLTTLTLACAIAFSGYGQKKGKKETEPTKSKLEQASLAIAWEDPSPIRNVSQETRMFGRLWSFRVYRRTQGITSCHEAAGGMAIRCMPLFASNDRCPSCVLLSPR